MWSESMRSEMRWAASSVSCVADSSLKLLPAGAMLAVVVAGVVARVVVVLSTQSIYTEQYPRLRSVLANDVTSITPQ